MKKLYLLRHADAVAIGPGKKDSDRALTDFGRKQAVEVALEAQLKKFSFDAILTSPYTRALETARIFSGVYGMSDKVVEEPLLACGCSVTAMRKIFRTIL